MWHCQMTTCIDVAVTPYATVTADALSQPDKVERTR